MKKFFFNDLKIVLCLSIFIYTVDSCFFLPLYTSNTHADKNSGIELCIPDEQNNDFKVVINHKTSADTLTITDLQGNRINLMRAVRDSSTGDMVPTMSINEAVVTTRFKHVAERHGKLDFSFDIKIPGYMQDSDCQLRLEPTLIIADDSLSLDKIYITGKRYRKKQLKGYELYNRFLSHIITDSTELEYNKLLDIFISRYLPKLYKIKNDSSLVKDTSIYGIFGITYDEAEQYYRKKFASYINNRRINKIEDKYKKYIKCPIEKQNIRQDTVIYECNDIIYRYNHSIETCPNIKKVYFTLKGFIYKRDKKIYSISSIEPIVFYISSISSLIDNSTHYINKIIKRIVKSSTYAYIKFPKGKCEVIDSFNNNYQEIARINKILSKINSNQDYILDSMIITTSCSPEGSFKINDILSDKRAKSIIKYFHDFLENKSTTQNNITFIPRRIPEEWSMLKQLIVNDTLICDKVSLLSLWNDSNLDKREYALSKTPDYQYIIKNIYPKLRTSRFDFIAHRRGMIKDTIITCIPDTIYHKGQILLKAGQYSRALNILIPYKDINTSIAYLSLDLNTAAEQVLLNIKHSATRDYLLAITECRLGNSKSAAQYLINSIKEDPNMRFRSHLDPEISSLVKEYNINIYE